MSAMAAATFGMGTRAHLIWCCTFSAKYVWSSIGSPVMNARMMRSAVILPRIPWGSASIISFKFAAWKPTGRSYL